ncbi:L-isoaspartate family protein [Blastomonas sp. RAC04]|jgi:protein-L-isoaspartate(D-aspartate) O-methyltransferase|uniref:protein-L-isoaspartate O-methyltransferase family protein n=1 Tax=unclassified Blastomonas TaxID=2626550 RepID=UPI00083CF062|nr:MULTISPECIES: protein-L-isoaspartate O-methyltransferase [unclassified Blastomonas]AOF99113.1 L-isoaspartate family protein [Blastomonas sp. RAC04]
MTDTHTLAPPDFAAARRHMIESQLRPSDVSDPVVIAAMAVTRREDFVPAAQQHLAYIDRAVPLSGGRVLNPALSSGLLLTRAELSGNEKVLLIGAGTGYLAALLAGIVARVVAVEDNRALVEHASSALGGMANVSVIESDLTQGHAADAPYDLIIIDGAVQQVPDSLVAQLAEGGRLLAGVDEAGVSRLAMGRRQAGAFALIPFADTDIAPLAAFARPKSYSF